MRIIFVGPPGAGKGTQCERCANHFRLHHLSTGQWLRERSSQSSDDASLIARYIDGGNLAPDQMMMKLVEQQLGDLPSDQGWLLDGFPRTLIQAEMFDQYLDSQNSRIDRVIQLTTSEDVLIERLLGRASKQHRADDQIDTITKRLSIYRERTAPVLDYYDPAGLIETIDAQRSPDLVFQDICDSLQSLLH